MIGRLWAVLAAGIIAGFAGGVLAIVVLGRRPIDQPRQLDDKVIVASAFQVVDSDGNVRAALSVGEDGTPALAFWDEEGTCRASLRSLPAGKTVLVLADESGQARVSLGAAGPAGPALALSDDLGRIRVILSAGGRYGHPGLSLRDTADVVRVQLQISRYGSPRLALCDHEGKPRAEILAYGVVTTLELHSPVGHVSLLAGHTPATGLFLLNRNNGVRAGLVLDPFRQGGPASFYLRDEDGDIHFARP